MPIVMQLIVIHRLNVHFVDADGPGTESFHHKGVLITLTIHKGEDAGFASVMCSGRMQLTQPHTPRSTPPEQVATSGGHRFTQQFPFFVPPDIDSSWDSELGSAYEHIEDTLGQVATLLRWRFHLSGQDSVFAHTQVVLRTDDGHRFDLRHIAQAAMGDDRAAIDQDGLSELARMLTNDMNEPLAHQLWREAWNLRLTNPRSSLVIGVTAAEVGLKQLIAALVPLARWLVEQLPSPPLVSMTKSYLPELPIRAEVEADRRCPRHLRSILDTGVKARNAVVHRGAAPNVNLHTTLNGVREFLYLLDFYEGHAWALTKLSAETIKALGVSHPTADPLPGASA